MSAGKGDRPRSNFSKSFREGYDGIDWGLSKIKWVTPKPMRRVSQEEAFPNLTAGYAAWSRRNKQQLK